MDCQPHPRPAGSKQHSFLSAGGETNVRRGVPGRLLIGGLGSGDSLGCRPLRWLPTSELCTVRILCCYGRINRGIGGEKQLALFFLASDSVACGTLKGALGPVTPMPPLSMPSVSHLWEEEQQLALCVRPFVDICFSGLLWPLQQLS